MNDIISLDQNISYNLRAGVNITRRNITATKFGFEAVSTIVSIRSILLGKLPSVLKNAASLNILKHKIKKWTPQNCPCKICRKFF